MALRKSVELYYDVMCPYSWIAFEHLCKYRTEWDVDLVLKPFSLSAVFAVNNPSHPGNVPTKFHHMCKDAEIQGKYHGIPIKTPTNAHDKIFTRGSLPAMRLLTAVNLTRPDVTEHLSRSLWTRLWNKDDDLTHRQNLIKAGHDIGLTDTDMEYFLSKVREKCTTFKLRSNTDDALKLGAFGAPTIAVPEPGKEPHVVYGSDRLHILANILGKTYAGPACDKDLLLTNTGNSTVDRRGDSGNPRPCGQDRLVAGQTS